MVLSKSNSRAGRASWRYPALGTKLARTLQNDDFSDFALLQCEIPEFVWALTRGKRYFRRFSFERLKPSAQIKQRAGDFNSFRLPKETIFHENHENQEIHVS